MSAKLYIPQSPDNPIYIWAVQWQLEDFLVPKIEEFSLKHDALNFIQNELLKQSDLAFVSLTRRLA